MSYQQKKGFKRTARSMLTVVLIAMGSLCLPSLACANYEEAPEHFGVSGEAEQLNNSEAIAVNDNGAGGVEAGSIYVVGKNSRVLRFSHGAEGEPPQFREAWGWGIGENAGGPLPEFQRCGPAYAAEPRPAGTFPTCRPPDRTGLGGLGGEQAGNFTELGGVAVDQATGDVYVLNGPNPGYREHHLIEIFTPTGQAVGEGFGDWGRSQPGNSPESIAEGPQNLHKQGIVEYDGIAVDDTGIVYVIDRDFAGLIGSQQARVMSFEPAQSGDYERYVYAGQNKDVTTSSLNAFIRVALVGSNDLVAGSGEFVREYATGGGSEPVCTHHVSGGQLAGLTANSVTGEVFYFVRARHPVIHRLGPCNTTTHDFPEIQELAPTPQTEFLLGLAVNPHLAWSAHRPAGILYGVDSEVHGTIEPKQRGIGDVFVTAEAEAPVVTSESVLNTTSITTTFQAMIDPRGSTTKFRFQYLTKADYDVNGESFEGPKSPGFVPSSSATVGNGGIATAVVSGLVPDTEYRFRVIATSECLGPGEHLCEAVGPTAAFSAYPISVAGLPDGRVYELVSPIQKQGGEVFPADSDISSCLVECKPPGVTSGGAVFPVQSVAGGDEVAYEGYPFSSAEGAAVFNSYISRRTSAGWQTTAMSPRLLAKNSELSYSESLGEGLITQTAEPQLTEDAPNGYGNLYLQQAGNPTMLQPLLTRALFQAHPPHREPLAWTLEYDGHSPDFSAQYFAVNDALTGPGAYVPEPVDPGPSGRDLYEWRGGSLSLVNVLPGNTTVATGASFASASPDTHAVSVGGHRVFWDAGGHLYVREDNRITREVHDPGSFLTASPDGLEVLLSDGCLYSLTSAKCMDLTQGQGGFLGVVGQSDDLSRIYFVDKAALTAQAKAGTCQSPIARTIEEENEGEVPAGFGCNLYLYEAGVGTRLVATLPVRSDAGGVGLDDWAAPGQRTAEASPNGRYLAFGSNARLTGYDNVGPCEGSVEGSVFSRGPCKEAFLYDATTGRLTCPSCNSAGEVPLGNSTLRVIRNAQKSAWLPQPRYLTNQGRLFFDSSERLSPQDTNGGVEDVYEAEPEGVGSCGRATGCVSLISPGTGSVDSNFLAMDENGENVFFTSREQLVKQDTDGLIDVYGARVGGGFASESEVPECHGETCQPTVSPLTTFSSGTSNFLGAGNIKPENQPENKPAKIQRKAQPCPKGKIKQNGKCVVKRKAKKQKKKAKKRTPRTSNHKRGGAK
jgi:hypothetical protein